MSGFVDWRFAGSMLVLLFCSCNPSSWKMETIPLTGTISINGNAPEGATIRLLPAEGKIDQRGSIPAGVVGPDGSYSLTTYQFDDGVPTGTYDLTVMWLDGGPLGPDRLKNQFDGSGGNVMRVTITDDTTELPPIELNDVKILPERN